MKDVRWVGYQQCGPCKKIYGNDVAPRNPGKSQTRTDLGSSAAEQSLLLASFVCLTVVLPLSGESLEQPGGVVPLVGSHTPKPVSQLATLPVFFVIPESPP